MGVVLVIGLLVAVITLGWLALSQGKTINEYEKELIEKARKSKNGRKK